MNYQSKRNKVWLAPPMIKTEVDNYKQRLNEAANTIWKQRYIRGEVTLHQLRIKEINS